MYPYSFKILMGLEFVPKIFSKKKPLTYQIFMKMRQMGAELFDADKRTDGQTDMTMLIVTFHNFLRIK